MSELTSGRFDEFFRAVHGHGAYEWQQRLATQVVTTGRWPGVLDLPTGSGKTSVIDIAVFALACRPSDMARRIVYVVDRRIIVAQTAAHVARLNDRIGSADAPILDQVRGRLVGLQARDGAPRPLAFAELRGGIDRDESWAMRPDVPAVLVSTVDQVGSRLLFRGYGVSPGMRPIHAGLLGNDCLYLLDEVHLAEPFAGTLRSLASDHAEALRGVPSRRAVVEMSATIATTTDEPPFSIGQEDLAEEPVLATRLLARKDARLVVLGRRRDRPEDALADELPGIAADLPGQVVGVVVNRVETARRVAAALNRVADADVALVTGRMRPLDRDQIWERIAGRVTAGRSRDPDQGRLYLVATQTVEAGADLDLDALVTEVAPLDALRQRFGRVDRRGELAAGSTPAQIVVAAAAAQTAPRHDDAVYGAALQATWSLLHERHGDAAFDAGPLSEDVQSDDRGVLSPSERAPLLLRHHLELLAQTKPSPVHDPPVEYWLHGIRDADADVQLVWRGERALQALAPGDDATAVDVLTACPPRTSEALALPISAALRWLASTGGAEPAPVADVTAAVPPDEQVPGVSDRGWLIRWRGADTDLVQPQQVRPGDTIIVPAAWGGLSDDGAWDPTSVETVSDLGDLAQGARGRPTLRLEPGVLRSLGVSDFVAHLPPDELDATDARPDDPVAASLDRLAGLLGGSDNADGAPSWLREIVDAAATGVSSETVVAPAGNRGQRGHADPYHVLHLRGGRSEPATFDTDGGDASHSFLARAVTLEQHCDGVGERAEQFATACGLPSALGADLRLAGRLHDLGKADPRFQAWLHGGDEIASTVAEDLLAKSSRGRVDAAARRVQRRRARYPEGQRHELLSLALATSDPAVLANATDPDLVLHLVTTHHGYARFLPPRQDDPDPREVHVTFDGRALTARTDHGLDALGSGVVDRHTRVIETYGHYGIAWLEALFRLADHRQSADEETG